MKRLLLFYIILIFGNSFSSAASGIIFSNGKIERNQITREAVFPKSNDQRLYAQSYESLLFFKKDSKELTGSDSQIKRKAVELECAELAAFCEYSIYPPGYDQQRAFFGLTNLYLISLHTYLHLYQLF